MRRIRLLAPLALVCAALGSACSSDGPTNGGGGGSITLNLSGTTLSVAQGASGNLTATIARAGNFTGAVAIAVTGLPANVTATANPASIAAGQTTSTITFTAAANAAAATTTVTVTASGSGVTAQTRTFSLTITAASAGNYTFTLNPTGLSIQQGGQSTTTLTLNRTGGFAGNVTFSQTGAPAGMTVTFNPTSTTGNSTTVTVAVGAAVTAQVHNVTLTGTATGLGNVTINLPVTVTTSGGGGNATFRSCGPTMLFAAFQDGTGAWTATTITNNTITFNLASGRGGIAYVTGGANNFQVFITYGSLAELNTGATTCPVAPTLKTVTGSVANVTAATDIANIALGTGFASVIPLLSSNYTMTSVPDVVVDLIAGRMTQTVNGANILAVLNKGIIRRAQNPPANSVIPVLDFNAAESFTPVSRTLTIGNIGTDAVGVTISFISRVVTSGQTGLGIFLDLPGGTTPTRQFPTVPAANTVAGDLYGFSLFTTAVGGASRGVLAYHAAATDRTITLPPALGAVTVTAPSTAPVLLRAQYTIQPEFNRQQSVNYGQTAGGVTRSYTLNVNPGYLTSTTFDFTLPNLTALTGWQAAWNLVTGTQVTWTFNAFGGSATGIVDGTVVNSGSRSGTITP